MGRICVVNFISLDGVIQSPLAAGEERDGSFGRGGWVVPLSDDVVDDFMRDATVGADALLMGRRTHKVVAAAWAEADDSEEAVAVMNRMPTYVVPSRDPAIAGRTATGSRSTCTTRSLTSRPRSSATSWCSAPA